MYKVFVNEKPLTFSEAPLEGVRNMKYENESTFDVAVNKLEHTSIPALNVFYHNLEKLWGKFTNHYDYLEAAGGIVLNEDEKILFIKRYNKWDLPKGKVEEGESLEETALREINEECGVNGLVIQDFLLNTYHVYKTNQHKLKSTHWYQVYCNDGNSPVPQKEEGIEEVKWLDQSKIPEIKENSYQNIRLLLNTFLENNK